MIALLATVGEHALWFLAGYFVTAAIIFPAAYLAFFRNG
jgi:hypothetical protein